MATDQVRANTFRGFREYVAELGGDGDAYLRAADIAPESILDADNYVSLAALIRVFELAAADLKRSDFGLQFGLRQGPGITGALLFAVMNCETAREGIACAARFIHFHNRGLRLSIESLAGRGCDLIVQEVALKTATPALQQGERQIAFQHRVLQRLCGPRYKPVEIWFRHRALSPIEVYREAFGVTPLFNRPHDAIVADSAVLDERHPGRSAHVRQLAEAYLEAQCPASDATITQRVRSAIEVMMGASAASQTDVARVLAMHERTLQRRLKDEGVVFEDIKDGVRRHKATVYLRQRDLPLSQVAELLGYAEPSAFSRSCRRWFGESPREVRKRLAA
ncbi:MAG: AraC family transcriptional regulator [Hyphomonadaceae bacterium]